MNPIVLLVGIVAVALALPTGDYVSSFNDFKTKFNKTYSSQVEEQQRFAAFVDNMNFINQHNAEYESGLQTYTVGVNQFADLTLAEFRAQYLSPFKSERPKNVVILPEIFEDSIDWRSKGAVTPVKDQGQCGSCWAFSSTGSIEGAHQISTGSLVSVSEQQLVDCSGAQGNMGCNGGLMDYAFTYVINNHGITTESNYGYTARDGTCNAAKAAQHDVTIASYNDVAHNSEAQLKAAVTQQPVSVAIEADQSGFQFYKSGIFSGPCGTQLDHGVLAVGYGTQGTTDYWIVKNSWGVSWGDQGYILMAQGKGAAGICGIAMESSYPVVAKTAVKAAATHYEDPKPNGCASDELSAQIQGVSGDFCSPYCSIFKPCPKDVPAGSTATPECVLGHGGAATNCALICTPGTSPDQCPTGATCKAVQTIGLCTYDD